MVSSLVVKPNKNAVKLLIKKNFIFFIGKVVENQRVKYKIRMLGCE